MKRPLRNKTIFFLVALLLIGCGVGTVSAADYTLSYNGSNTLTVSAQDFFGSEGKNLMPGSSFSKDVDIANKGKDAIVVYLRAELDEDAYTAYALAHPDITDGKTYVEQLIKEMNIDLRYTDPKHVVQPLYNGPASGDPKDVDPTSTNAGMTTRSPNGENGIMLGSLSAGAVAQLDFDVAVPTSLGNEYQNTASLVKWIFICEVSEVIDDESNPLDPPTPPPIDGPQTGDNFSIWPMAVVISLLVLSSILLFLTSKRRKKGS